MSITLRAMACLLAGTALLAQTPDELLIVNARIFTGSSSAPWAEALLSRGDRTVAVGTEEALRARDMREPYADRGDMRGRINFSPADLRAFLYTRGPAYAEHREQEKGTLEPGKLADFAILSQDIFTVAPPDLPKTTSVVTVGGGRVVHEAK